MKKQLLSFIACVLALSGCSIFHKDSTPPDPTRPRVAVVSDQYIVVDQEPLVFLKDQRNVTITWHLPKESKYRFQPRNGIDIEERGRKEITDCTLRADGLEFSCVNRHTIKGKYSYTIRLALPDGSRPIYSDPSIYNE